MKAKLPIIFLAFVILASGCIQTSGETGTIQGKATIGPLCPVEPCDISDDQVASIYVARKVFAYDQATRKLVTQANLDRDGKYSITVPSGNYIVDISDADGNPLPLEDRQLMGNAQPQEVTVKAKETVALNFEIDTGIR